MKTTGNGHRRLLFSTLALLSVAWLAVPHAGQDGANDGFILFTTDRDNPSDAGDVQPSPMRRHLRDGARRHQPGPPHAGGGAPTDPAAYNSGGADWSHSKKLIAFQSNRVDRVPQIHLMNLDGTEQQLLVSLPGGAAFPSFSQSGNELCFHGQTTPRDIYIVNVHGTGLTNLTSPDRLPGQPGLNGDNIRCDWSAKGNAIAFTSNRAGNQEIYVIDADGTGLAQTDECRRQRCQPCIFAKGRPHRVRE